MPKQNSNRKDLIQLRLSFVCIFNFQASWRGGIETLNLRGTRSGMAVLNGKVEWRSELVKRDRVKEPRLDKLKSWINEIQMQKHLLRFDFQV